MERAATNPFRILSAYLMTAATTSPPSAWGGRKGGGEGEKKRIGEERGREGEGVGEIRN